MRFAEEFVSEVKKKRESVRFLFNPSINSDVERRVRETFLSHWHPLPSPCEEGVVEFAVDGSSAMRSLANGTDLFIARALMIGSDGSAYKKLRFEAIRGIPDPELSSLFLRILTDITEIQVVLENLDKIPRGSILLLDGSLYGRYTHITKQLPLEGWEGLPLLVYKAIQDLLGASMEWGFTVIGVSKHSKTRALCHALLQELGYLVEGETNYEMPDSEMIFRWARFSTSGYSTPLLLGNYAIYRRDIDTMIDNPEAFVKRYFPSLSSDERKRGARIVGGIPETTAIAMFHLLPAWGDSSLRVDVPASSIGLEDRIKDVKPFRFCDPKAVEGIVGRLLADRGGRDVYNALLYVVDREVRMERRVVDEIYRSILRRELGLNIEYERGARRFLS
jgi:hypothetical protein